MVLDFCVGIIAFVLFFVVLYFALETLESILRDKKDDESDQDEETKLL